MRHSLTHKIKIGHKFELISEALILAVKLKILLELFSLFATGPCHYVRINSQTKFYLKVAIANPAADLVHSSFMYETTVCKYPTKTLD